MKSIPKRGILFAATGPKYLRLGIRAARSARAANPGVAIDLATDQPERPNVFDEVRSLSSSSRHAKLHAMPETRFEQTLFLDCDLFVLANIEDVFSVLDRFDIALAHDQFRSSERARNTCWRAFANAYPQFNSGVIAYRRTEPVLAFLRNWRDAVLTSQARYDQPSLRELIWQSPLRIATLPPEYNFMCYKQLRAWSKDQSAPRILHHPHFHAQDSQSLAAVPTILELMGAPLTRKLRRALAWDAEVRNEMLIRPSASDGARGWLRWLLKKVSQALRLRNDR